MKRMLAAMVAGLLLLAACGQQPAESLASVGGSTRRHTVDSDQLQFLSPQAGDTIATIETSRGTITVVLYPAYAPLAVENFSALAGRGYYDDTVFHRVVKDFMVQAGDATGTGLSGESIWGHPFATERSAMLYHYTGAVCMAAADGLPDTHLSQFYIVAAGQDTITEEAADSLTAAGLPADVVETYRQAGGAPYLDNTDTVFGQVISGMDVVDAIAAVAVDEENRPKDPVTILSITITTYTASGAESAVSILPAQVDDAGASAAGSMPEA